MTVVEKMKGMGRKYQKKIWLIHKQIPGQVDIFTPQKQPKFTQNKITHRECKLERITSSC